MKALFDIEKLVDFVSKQLDVPFSKSKLEELLSVGEDAYHKDSPLSVGKSLKISSIEFSGKKVINGEEVDFKYDRKFSNGVYLWIGDNLVGKSSIFKVIKLALTGSSSSLKQDVSSWINEVWLEFELGTKNYTINVTRGKQGYFQFKLQNGGRQSEFINQEENKVILFEGGTGNYEVYIESFFFRELNYYSLQWTQHPSKKDNPILHTSNASWKTYFKSIYLEAEDYNVLVFGQQSELIFQMLLGLELTYPINRLKIKKELLQNQLGLSKNILPVSDDQSSENKNEETKKELSNILVEIEDLKYQAKEATKPKQTGNERKLEDVRAQYRKAIVKRAEIENEINHWNSVLIGSQRKLSAFNRQIDEYRIDIGKKARAIIDLKDYLELGAFFNGLEVKSCPNCNHAVEKFKVQQEKTHGICRLCDHEVAMQEFEGSEYEDQLNRLQNQYDILNSDHYQLKAESLNEEKYIQKVKIYLAELEEKSNSLQFDSLQKQIEELQQTIVTNTNKPYDWDQYTLKLSDLTIKRTLLEQKLIPIKSDSDIPQEQQQLIEHKIMALEIAEQELKRQREERSIGPVQTFEKLYLNQLHSLGLPHYERVELKPNFKIAYFMHGNELGFDQISPGEQLRAKLSLYISLIEMDIEHQLGRHPRFIILDSPAKEEGDRRFVEGIKSTLEFIQNKFGVDLQVFVGTAQRELTTAANEERVEEKAEGEFFF